MAYGDFPYHNFGGYFPRPQGEFPMSVPTREYRAAKYVIDDTIKKKVEEAAEQFRKDREELERLRQERDILFEYAVKDRMLECAWPWNGREESEKAIREMIDRKIKEKGHPDRLQTLCNPSPQIENIGP